MSGQFQFILGNDEFLVDRRAQEIFTPWKNNTSDEYSIEILDARAQKLEDVTSLLSRFQEAAQTDSLFGDSKTIWLRNVNFLGDDRIGKSAANNEETERLRTLIESLSATEHNILISACPVDRKRSFYKWAAKRKDSEFIDQKKEGASAFTSIIKDECTNSGYTIAADAVETLRGKLNGETRMAVEEIRKVITAMPKEETKITAQRIMEEVPEFGEAEFFEAADKFFQGDLPTALEAVRRHFFIKKEGRPLLSNLMNRNRLMIQIKVLVDAKLVRKSGYRIDEESLRNSAEWAAEWYGNVNSKNSINIFAQNNFYLGNLAESARKTTLRKLIDRQSAFVDAFKEMIDRPNDTEAVFRELVIRCLGRNS